MKERERGGLRAVESEMVKLHVTWKSAALSQSQHVLECVLFFYVT